MVVQVSASLGLVAGSLALGAWLRQRGRLDEHAAARLVRFIVKGPSPIVLCLTVWQMDLRRWEPWVLPLTGLLVSGAALLPAWAVARRARLTRPETGSFLICAFFSNVGYVGAFVAFALWGEAAFGLCVLYYLLFTPSFYTVGFGLAAHYGHHRQGDPGIAAAGELRLFPLLGLVGGAILNAAGFARPAWLGWVNHALIPLDTAVYLIAIGSQLALTWPIRHLPLGWTMSAIKFVYCPLVGLALANVFELTGLMRAVVLLEAATPVAVSPLVLPLLFGLDRELANSVWLVTTVLAIPWLILWVPLLKVL